MNAVCVTEAKADTLYAYPISEGWYYISPQCAPSRCLDVAGGRTDSGTNIQIYSRNYSGAQLFHLTYIGDGYYIITSYLGKVLDGQGGRSKSGTNIHTWDFNNGYNQAFRIENAGGGYYYLKYRQNTNLALDVSGGVNRNSANVQVYTWNNSNAQKWSFSRAASFEKNSAVSRVRSTTNHKPATFNIKTNGRKSTITIWTCNLNWQQKYYIKDSGKLSVRVYSGNKLIKDTIISGYKNRIKIDKKYKNYTVYISQYQQTGKGIIGRTIAGGNNFTNTAFYCMISLDNAKIN